MSAVGLEPCGTHPGGPQLHVDLAAVAANTHAFVARTAPSGAQVMAVVKADGFGHGAVEAARTALGAGAHWLGVTTIEEGLELRAAGLQAPLLSWLNPVGADFGAASHAGIDIAVPSQAHLDAVVRLEHPTMSPARVHLHLDCGLARDGAEPAAWPGLCCSARRAERAGLVRVVGVMGHQACAEDPVHAANATGRIRFAWGVQTARAAGLRPALRHLAATAATLTDPRSHHTLVRIGAGLVGIDPSGTTRLRPALRLTAPVVAVRRVGAGTGVGYGHSWTTPRTTRLALLPVGYADGLPRAASGRAEVLLRGRRRPVVGQISMDQVVVDLGADGDAATVVPGETAVVFGPGDDGEPTAAEWAGWAGTIEHELITGLGRRPRRDVRPALSLLRNR
jgi:alanine racemase